MDKYLLGPVLARTPHSMNFRAVDTTSQKQVALKVLNSPRCDFEQRLIDNEIAIMRRVKHPYLLNVLDVLEISGRKIIVTPLARGTLADFVRPDYRNPETVVRRVIEQLLKAIQFLHSLSIVHRDVKPANIYVMNEDEQNPEIVLADFGYAAELDKEFRHEFVGSSAFIAPEIYAGQNCMIY
jgi:serine/threonine protein kinase